VVVRSNKESAAVTTTFADTTRAPVESATVPVSDPREFCAPAPTEISKHANTHKTEE
jgi:hypothetical protein